MTDPVVRLERLKLIAALLTDKRLVLDRRASLEKECDKLLADEGVKAAWEAACGSAQAAAAATGRSEQGAAGIDFSSIPPADGYDTLAEFQAEVTRLAALPLHEYDRLRKDEAKRLNVRVGTLDKSVKAARPRDEAGRAGRAIVLSRVEPCADPVDGGELIQALVDQFSRFVVASDAALVAVALWTLHTHAFKAWWISPKLLFRSATKRCGKSRFFEVLERVVARRLLVSAATCSSVFRVIESQGDDPPTLLMDEADKLTQRDDDMRRLINAGHTKASAQVMISVPTGDGGWESWEFSTWAPIALAGIGGQADTVLDRAVIVTMRRKPVQQIVERLRGNRDYGFHELAARCARWAQDHVEALTDADPDAPAGLHDRAQDNWLPLLAVADAAGGEWPARARQAALLLLQVAEEQDPAELGVQLIHDIVAVLDEQKIDEVTTKGLLLWLHEMEERVWSAYGKAERPITSAQLAELLRQFEVKSRQLWIEVDGKKVNRWGFERGQFIPLLARYPSEATRPRRNPGQKRGQRRRKK